MHASIYVLLRKLGIETVIVIEMKWNLYGRLVVHWKGRHMRV